MMTKYARWKSPGVPEIFDGGRDIVTGEGEDAVRHPRNIVNVWTDAELQAIGLMKLVEAITPAGEIVTGRSWIEVASEIHEQLTTEPAPPAPPDPQTELDAAIAAATTLDELKAALLGQGNAGRVAGRPA